MKRIILLILLFLPAAGWADDPTDYYILHNTKVDLTEKVLGEEAAEDPDTERIILEGYRQLHNPNSSITVCRTLDSCSAGRTITFPTITLNAPSSLDLNPDYTNLRKFRVFVPPGATHVSLKITTEMNRTVKTAVRMNYVPQVDQSLAITEQGSYELRYLDYHEINLKTANSQISVYGDSPYPLEDDNYPLSEDHSGWVYVNVFSGVQNIESISYSLTVSTMVYRKWYQGYYTGSDDYGLDNQDIIPAIAAFAGSQILKQYGLQISDALLDSLGIKFENNAGTSMQSSLDTGEGTVIPFGCCDWACCVGVGIMATPQGVQNAFDAFENSTINRLDQLFIDANITFYDHWQAIVPEYAKNREALAKLVEHINNEWHRNITQFGMAQQELKIQEKFGEKAKFDTMCLGENIAKAIQVQKDAEKKLHPHISQSADTYRESFKNPDTIFEHHLAKDTNDLSGQVLLTSSGTMDVEQIKKAMAMNELILDPYPELQLPESKKTTRHGQRYETLRIIKKAHLAIAQDLLSANITQQAPTIDSAIVNKVLTDMGVTEGLLPEDTRISSKQFSQILIDSKNANPNWYTQIADKNSFGLEREQLVVKALTLEQELQELFKLHKQTMLKAQLLAAQVNETMDPQLIAEFKKAASL